MFRLDRKFVFEDYVNCKSRRNRPTALLYKWCIDIDNRPTKPVMQTLEEMKIEELESRLGRKPTEVELRVKEIAETEAMNQIDATPSGCYVMEEIVDEHRQRLAEELGVEPFDEAFELFKEIYLDEITSENVNREMMM